MSPVASIETRIPSIQSNDGRPRGSLPGLLFAFASRRRWDAGVRVGVERVGPSRVRQELPRGPLPLFRVPEPRVLKCGLASVKPAGLIEIEIEIAVKSGGKVPRIGIGRSLLLWSAPHSSPWYISTSSREHAMAIPGQLAAPSPVHTVGGLFGGLRACRDEPRSTGGLLAGGRQPDCHKRLSTAFSPEPRRPPHGSDA